MSIWNAPSDLDYYADERGIPVEPDRCDGCDGCGTELPAETCWCEGATVLENALVHLHAGLEGQEAPYETQDAAVTLGLAWLRVQQMRKK